MRAFFHMMVLFLPVLAHAQAFNGPPLTTQQIQAAASGVSAFSNCNVAMPNGANIAHTIYKTNTPTTITGTTDQSVFASGGQGSQTVSAACGFLAGAEFDFKDSGIATTGTLNTSAVNAKILFGSTVIASQPTGSLPVNISSIPFRSDVTCDVQAAGVSGQVICTGFVEVMVSAAWVPAALFSSAAVSLDLSGPLKLDATASFTNTTGSPSLVIKMARIVQMN